MPSGWRGGGRGRRALADVRETELRSAAASAVSAERQMFARELHDVVSHAVGLIAVQSGAAEVAWLADPAATRESLRVIGETAGSALAELNRLSPDPQVVARTPTDLYALVERIRSAGTQVELHADLDSEAVLGPEVFRTVQEGLTNVVRHAPGASALVRITTDEHETVVVVVDAAHRGYGLVGLAERMAFAGGVLETGPGPEGRGFRVAGDPPQPSRTGRMTVRVVVVDDNELLRAGLLTVLGSDPEITVVGEAGSGPAGAREALALQPDLVLMDVEMPGGDGITATRQILDAAPQIRVLILTMFDLDDYVVAALRAGASGFLLKTTDPQALIRAVKEAAAGNTTLGPTVLGRLVDSYVTQNAPTTTVPGLADLTSRELDVLRSMTRGLSNAEIAAELFLAETTVKTHVARVLAKLGVRDRVQAVVLAHQAGVAIP